MAKSPDAFRTISEVAAQLETPAHVLRFWESKFTQIKPVKRAGGRRYYRPDDIALLGGIKVLLHEQGVTIRGVQKLLRERGARHVATLSALPWEGTDLEEEVAEEAAEVVVGPWPGASVDAAEEELEDEPAAPEPLMGEASLARLREALAAADPARLSAQRAGLSPLLGRLRALRDGAAARSA